MTSEERTEPDPADAVLRDELRELRVHGAVSLRPLTHNRNNAVTAGVWRVDADNGFKAVLKVLSPAAADDGQWQPSDEPHHWNYWRREAEAYRSGLTDEFREVGIRSPRLLASFDRPDGTIALWLELVEGRPGSQIDSGSLTDLSHRLGLVQGRLARSATDLPPWASHGFLRGYIDSKEFVTELDDDRQWEQPLVAECFPPGLRAAMTTLHREREWFLTLAESLPRVLSHLDVWPNNVLFAADGEVVLLDWAFVGDGCLGEDVGNLVPDTFFDLFLPASDFKTLAERAVDSYLAGVGRSGWSGDLDLVRLGIYASAVKYDWLTHWMLDAASDEQQFSYGGQTTLDARLKYRERGAALAELGRWAHLARELVSIRPDLVDEETGRVRQQ